MAELEPAKAQQLIAEIDELLAMRQGFVSAYRKWQRETVETLRQQLGEDVAKQFEEQGPRATPINRQHRVHLYRQTLDAQRRFLSRVLDGEA